MTDPAAFPEPSPRTADSAALFTRYLDFYRETLIRKCAALSEADLRRSRLGSGWTPIELLNHVAHMERRWFVWGFLGEHVDAPWGDGRDDRWHVEDDASLEQVVTFLRGIGARTRDILATRSLEETGAPGGRFDQDAPPLAWICFHVLQEYARHAGHLDIAVELAGGPTGE